MAAASDRLASRRASQGGVGGRRRRAAIISQVRAKAGMAGNGIYIRASIDVPKKGSPIGQPGQPTSFRHTLSPDGALRLTWKCKQPRGAVGTIYQVYRQIGMSG